MMYLFILITLAYYVVTLKHNMTMYKNLKLNIVQRILLSILMIIPTTFSVAITIIRLSMMLVLYLLGKTHDLLVFAVTGLAGTSRKELQAKFINKILTDMQNEQSQGRG